MTMSTLAALALGVLVWFGLAFGTRTWIKQWVAALIAGGVMAWWRFPAMQALAADLEIAPMSFFRFAAVTMAGMVLIASAGMGLYWLLQKSRRRA
jgi:hypothetical protein